MVASYLDELGTKRQKTKLYHYPSNAYGHRVRIGYRLLRQLSTSFAKRLVDFIFRR